MGEKNTYKILVLGLALSSVVSACDQITVETTATSEPPPGAVTTTTIAPIDTSGPIPVIVDYSPTVSDVGGLMYLLAHPDVNVIAISLPVTGEAGCDLGAEVTLGILAMFEREDVPVACDPDFPADTREWPPEFLAGHESLTAGLPEPDAVLSDEAAPDMIARVAAEAGRPVVLYAVAPLTNVARALQSHPDLAGNLERIVIMGGAVNAGGNVEGTNAEWNVWIDVPGAADVIGSGVPVTLVPLDATNFVPVPAWYPSALEGAEQTEAIVYLGGLVETFPSVTSGFFYFWDELAASVAAGESLTTTEERTIVVVEGGADDGRTVSDDSGSSVTVAIGVDDPDSFYANFLGILAGSPVEVGSAATPEEEAYLKAVEASFNKFFAALETVFSSPAFDDTAPYDGPALSEGIDLIFTALAASHAIISTLEPPESLADVHNNYLDVMGVAVAEQEEIVSAIAASTSQEEADAILTGVDFEEACLPLADAASLLGVEVEYPCG